MVIKMSDEQPINKVTFSHLTIPHVVQWLRVVLSVLSFLVVPLYAELLIENERRSPEKKRKKY